LPKLFATGSSAERRRALACCALALALTHADAGAEQRPFRSFTAADGLAHDRVASIASDSNGFVWFSTANGLSRFDGSRFVNYGAAQGLPDLTIAALLELDGGAGYLVATNGGGVAWYRPDNAARSTPRFEMFPVSATDAAANRVNVLYRGRQRIWAGTDAGLYEISRNREALAFSRIELSSSSRGDARIHVLSVAEDAAETLWIGSATGQTRRAARHRTTPFIRAAAPIRSTLCCPNRTAASGSVIAKACSHSTVSASRPNTTRRATVSPTIGFARCIEDTTGCSGLAPWAAWRGGTRADSRPRASRRSRSMTSPAIATATCGSR
jgi:hypothetical protein